MMPAKATAEKTEEIREQEESRTVVQENNDQDRRFG
jgi:hypothetical protein